MPLHDLLRLIEYSDGQDRPELLLVIEPACLNIAEASGRVSPADKARVFACAAVELAGVLSAASPASVAAYMGLAARLVALLSGLGR